MPLLVSALQLFCERVNPPAEIDSPPLKVEVELEVNCIPPPITLSPPLVSIPAVPVATIPDLKVELAPSPPTFNTPWMVEEAPMIAEEEALSNPPICKLAEKVEEALEINPEEKVWRAVQVLALPRFSEATTAPVVGLMVRVLSVLVTDLTVQVPLIE